MNRPVSLSSVNHILSSFDLEMMQRCIALSAEVGRAGEFPFASVIAKNGRVIAQAGNRVRRDSDITRHAELLAVSEAQKVLGKGRLKGCALYSNVEPCAMCSFPIRESPDRSRAQRHPVAFDGRLFKILHTHR
ncbi:MAG TPA: nucleoside deaminase [Pseudolabrys sp.]|jgi:tRNA(adenine34) deaminase